MPQCACGSVLKDEKGLRKHKRLHCKLDRVQEELRVSCPDCNNKYPTQQSLQQHRRQTHPQEYNRDGELAAAGARRAWSDLEVKKLSEAEAQLEKDPCITFLNRELANMFHRTIDAIKGRRKQPAYRALMEAARTRLMDAELIPGDSTEEEEDPNEEDQFVTPPASPTSILSSRDSETSTPAQHEANTTGPPAEAAPPTASDTSDPPLEPEEDPVRDHLRGILEGREAPLLAELLAGSSDDVETIISSMLTDIVNEVRPDVRRQPANRAASDGKSKTRGVKKRKNESTQRRGKSYRIWQTLFRKDKRAIASHIIAGSSPDETAEAPDIGAVEEEYHRIFESPSPPDDSPFTPVEYGPDATYLPITREVIQTTITQTKPSAPGPDQITVKDIKRINPDKLEVLFNAMLAFGVIPSKLKACRTTLIPKKGDLTNVSNWRPITVSSLIMRTFSKIINSRLSKININLAQKGFRKIDGCGANALLIQTIIKEHRGRAAPYHIVTLDLRKAFDSVSKHSIAQALRRAGVHHRTIEVISDMYDGCTTTIRCAGRSTKSITISRGVKQGDPLSPTLFNLVMDELLCLIDHQNGLPIGDQRVAAVAYADDLLIMGPSEIEVQHTLNAVLDFLARRGLEINVNKCTALSTGRVPRKKKLFVHSKPLFNIHNRPVPCIDISSQFKYLGKNYNSQGQEKLTAADLGPILSRLHTAPLKPFQKFTILSKHLLPKFLWDLQYFGITKCTLRDCDLAVRAAARQILHLPKTTTTAFFYARIRDGGLGLLNLEKCIPIILRNRLRSLEAQSDPFTSAALTSLQGLRILNKLDKLTDGTTSTSAVAARFGRELDGSYSGGGLLQGNSDSYSGAGLHNTPPFWSGRDFVRAAQLRSNMLTTKGIPSNPPAERSCRAGGARTESLSHVLQRCHATHYSRINLAQYISSCHQENGYEGRILSR